MTTKRPTDLNITTRHPDFPLKESLTKEKYWMDGDPVKTHIFNALQATFPEGERFFIDSARDVRKRLPSGKLNAQLDNDIQAFIHQEAWHGKAHDEWVKVLEDLGYPKMRQFDEQIRDMRLWAKKNIHPLRRLAVTSGAEHLTASLARLILYRRPELLESAARPVRDLLAWHALEEVEHKAVCFDLFQQAGGKYQLRIVGLVIALTNLLRHVDERA
jgi:predicted metal-dependent hydrolase